MGTPEAGATLGQVLAAHTLTGVEGRATLACSEHASSCGGQPVAVDVLGFGPKHSLENATSTGPDGSYKLALPPGSHSLLVYRQNGQEAAGGTECEPAEIVVPAAGFARQGVTC